MRRLTRGQTHRFDVSAVSGHPLHITTAAAGSPPGFTNDVATGVSNNGSGVSPLSFTVPASGKGAFVYQCGIHSFMLGTIQVVHAPPAPALGAYAAALLVLALGAAGIAALQRSARAKHRVA
jgi:hypothetical protein